MQPRYKNVNIGALIIDIEGKELSAEDCELLAHPLVGGVILFTRNYENPKQLGHLCRAIRQAKKSPLLLSVDQEGGRVQRFKPEFTLLPAFGEIGRQYAMSPQGACRMAEDAGWQMATEILSVGIDISFAPVLDLYDEASPVIGDRAFHRDPSIVIELAQHFISGMDQAGMAATGKHFPGHGLVAVDSHTSTPVDTRYLAEIENNDLLPFIALMQQEIPALMMAHIIFSAIDPLPVSLSGRWLQDILRKKYQYTGVIFSDDLNMEGANISANYADRVLQARDAGCDFALVCNNRQGVLQAINQIDHNKHQVAPEKWGRLAGDFSRVREYAKHLG